MKKLHRKHKKSLDEQIQDELNKDVKEVKREWRQLLKFKDENQILFFAFVILIIALVVINSFYIIHRAQQTATPTVNKTVLVADSALRLTSQQAGKNVAELVKISNVTELDKKDFAFPLDEGEVLLMMDVTITNRTALKQQLIPSSQFYVRDDDGGYYPLHASMYVTKAIPATDMKPGDTVTGQVSFAVPKSLAHPLLYVDTGWAKVVPIVYDVLH